MAEWNHKKREENVQIDKGQSEPKLSSYGTGAIVAIGVLGISGYYVYQSKTPKKNPVHQTNEALVHRPKETPANKFEME